MKTPLVPFRLVILALLFLCLSQSSSAQKKKVEKTDNDKSFSFVVLGDMPYNLPQDYARFENVIKTINNQDQAFNIFIGDIKSSATPCSEEAYQKMLDYFGAFNKPLIYTPGDNEWTDCFKKECGAYAPEERLGVIRKMFFKDKESLGKEKMKLNIQSEQPEYEKFVENRRWDYGNVAFATIHIVGTNNNFLPNDKNFNKEFYERNKANIAWMKEAFKDAKTNNRAGVVLFVHADMFTPNKSNLGYREFLNELRRLTVDFQKPVLLINGDSHEFIVDKPLPKVPKVQNAIPNFTRLQVFGENEMHAVKVIINPSSPSLFQIEQLIVPENQ